MKNLIFKIIAVCSVGLGFGFNANAQLGVPVPLGAVVPIIVSVDTSPTSREAFTPTEPSSDLALPGSFYADRSSIIGCQQHLFEFIQNTEYLQPLLDYAECTGGLVPPVDISGVLGLADTVYDWAVSSLNIVEVGQACTISAAWNSSVQLSRVVPERVADLDEIPVSFGGRGSCGSTASSWITSLQSAAYGAIDGRQHASAGGGGSYSYRSSEGEYYASQTSGGAQHKVKVNATFRVSPSFKSRACSGSNICTVVWLMAPGKALNTGSSLMCRQSGDLFHCEVDSAPYHVDRYNPD